MTESARRTEWRWRDVVIAAAVGALAMQSGPAAAQAQDIGAASAGMRRSRDPQGGSRVESRRRPPLSTEASPQDRLRAEPVTVPAGGVKLNLRGRYRSAVRRAATADGTAPHVCDGPADGAPAHE